MIKNSEDHGTLKRSSFSWTLVVSSQNISKSRIIRVFTMKYFVHRQKTSPVTNIRYEGSASISMKELYGSPRNVSLSKSDFNSCAILRKISCAESCDSYCRIFHPNLLCGLPLNKKKSSGYNWTVNLKVSHLGKDPKTPVTKPCPLSFFLLSKRGRLCPRNSTVFYRRIL